MKKLAGGTDLEDALQELGRFTQEETRMALAELLRLTHTVRSEVKVVDDKVEIVQDRVADMGEKVQCVDEKVQQTANSVHEVKCSWSPDLAVVRRLCLDLLIGNQLKRLLRAWLSPGDMFINHNIAQKARHKGTAVWFFQGSIFIKWKSTGSLL